MASRSRISGRRGIHDENVNPLTANITEIALAALVGGCVGSVDMADVTIYHNPRCAMSRQA